MGNCTNRSTESPWAHHLGHCSPMFSWDPVKKLLSVKAKCLNSTRDTLMIRLAICWTQHQRLLFFRSWTTATLQLISLRKRKTMACFFFWECIVWTQHHKSRPKFMSNLPTWGLLLHNHSHVAMRYKRGLLKTMLDRAYRLSSCW